MHTRLNLSALLAAVFLFTACASTAQMPAPPSPMAAEETPRLDVVWVPTPTEVIDVMLDLAKVGPNDVVYDLGCGEGEILIAAAKRGARGVGVDLDPQRIRNARIKAREAGVANRITFIQQDLFKTDIKPATVVTLYLLPELNDRLQPTLKKDLKPGTPVVSHDFAMSDWKPEEAREVALTRTHRVYLWRIPAR